MIIWINGAFGAGKTTVSNLLVNQIADAHILDPEDIGELIRKTFPETRKMDYQDLAMWRTLTVHFIQESKRQFSSPLIIPMTLVVPEYLNEIFTGITNSKTSLFHFFLQTEKEELAKRIQSQVIVQNDPKQDEAVRQWRLAQIDRCYSASNHMHQNTIFLDTNAQSPDDLVRQIITTVRN
ncbi:MAG: tunicamycin resistance protein [Chloroflexota bacterium]